MTEYAYSRKLVRISSPTSMSTMCSSKSSGTRVGVLRDRATGAFSPSPPTARPGARRGAVPAVDSYAVSQDSSGQAAYPRHWEADVLLRDGGTAHLRPVSQDDAELVVAFYEQVSSQSKYYRFFAAMPTLNDRELHRFIDVDHHDRVALVLTVAERIIALGQFERLPGRSGSPGTEAEVAFLVQDRHQHRGIGQLLLEHLAQVGREVGVHRFVAEVLPDNVGMLQVFRDAGYQVAGGFEEGVMHMHFPIDPTETSVDVMQGREHRAERASVQRFFSARSVAIVGASRRHDTVGHRLVRNLGLGDYRARVYVVNSAADA